MTALTARVDAFVAGVKAACGYRRAARVPASMQEVLDLAEILRDSLRRDEQRAAILVLHQGPFFNGTGESHCLCGHPVGSGKEWAAHVNQVLEDGAL
ncbi:hypothetical protein [Mycolicibacterium setense]